MNEHAKSATETAGKTMKDLDLEDPWVGVDVTTQEDVDRNTHSAAAAERLRELAQELIASPQRG